MADYSYGQLESLWIQAGGSRALAPLMAAIALAESGGNPSATNPDDNNGQQTSWGLWQISNGTHSPPTPGILNPLTNAKAAVAKYDSQGLTAWGTYTSGAYQQYYQGSTPPSSLPQGGTTPAQATDASFISSAFGTDLANPVGLALYGIYQDIKGGQTDPLSGLAQTATIFTKSFTDVVNALEWWFVPSHQVRLFAGLVGLVCLGFGLPGLMKAGGGNQGDAGLAVSILLITLAGVAWFIAFHNLPDDVSNLKTLMAWISESVSEGRPASSATTTAQVA